MTVTTCLAWNSAAGDVDGDQVPEILIGGPADDDAGAGAGAVWLVTGATLLAAM